MSEPDALAAGDLLPHFTVTTVDGRVVRYGAIWQRRNLLLLSLPPGDAAGEAVAARVAARRAECLEQEAECVITHDRVPGVAQPGLVIADKWGEVWHVDSLDLAAGGPDVDEMLASLAHVRMKCPECEGEAK